MFAIDSQVLIWAVKQSATANRLHMIVRASSFFEAAQKRGQPIMIPSLVASEFLVRYDDPQRQAALAELDRRFFVAPFDARAAWLAAKLFADKSSWEKSRKDDGYSRQWIKTDIAILATAIAHGATEIYIEDEPLFNLALNLAA
jgi:predicted nucleic acid-binding protein